MLKAGILTIGDEILIGNTINTNAAWLGEKLTELGFVVNKHLVISDEKREIKSSLKYLTDFCDLIITTGGLGPTKDDITKNCLAEFFNSELKQDEGAKKALEEYFKSRNREILDRHYEQAYIPEKSEALINPTGTAPGIFTKQNGKYYFTLPGVPNEMKSIFDDSISDMLKDFADRSSTSIVYYHLLKTHGIYESKVAEILEPEFDKSSELKVAYLPSYSGVKIRLGIESETRSDGYSKLRPFILKAEELLKDYLLDKNEDLEIAVGNLLKKKGKTLSVAESCTGGGLGQLLTDISGSSDYFKGGMIVYSNQAKEDILNVKSETLEKHGAVSKETAEEMAVNIRLKLDSDFGISITGIAGPEGGSEQKPVGTVWIGIASENKVIAKEFHFTKNRYANRELSKYSALSMLYKKLT